MSDKDFLSEEDLSQLNKNQGIRNKLIDSIIMDGMPEDKNMQNFLVNLLNGSDSSVFNRAKLKAKKEENDDNRTVVDMMAKLLLRSNEVRKSKLNTTLDNSIQIEKVPGESDSSTDEELTYEEFIKDDE